MHIAQEPAADPAIPADDRTPYDGPVDARSEDALSAANVCAGGRSGVAGNVPGDDGGGDGADRDGRGPSRRTLLGSAVLGAGMLAVTGCGERDGPKAHPDVATLTAVMAGEEQLIALYEAVRRAHADLAGTVDPVLANHRQHLAALRRHFRPGTPPRNAPKTPARTRPVPPRVPTERRRAVERLRTAERGAATARGAEVGRVAPALAQLLASIGACEAGHEATLARLR